MAFMSFLRGVTLAALALLVAGCVFFPIPSKQESVDSGHPLTDDQLKAMISEGDTSEAIRTKFGEPLADFGPGRVLVYGLGTKKGSIGWIAVWPYGAASGTERYETGRLLIVALDADGGVLKAGTVDYSPLHTVSGQIHRWLSASKLAERVPGPRPDGVRQGGGLVVLYRPSRSPCPFMHFDAERLFDFSPFKLKVTVDGRTVGDLPKGAYLATEIGPDAHLIGVQSYSNFFLAGNEGLYSSFTGVNIPAEPGHITYIETYLCSEAGDFHVHAAVRDAATALAAMRGLKPAW